MCPVCSGEEEVPIPVWRWAAEIYGFLFAYVCMFWRVVLPWFGQAYFWLPKKEAELLTIYDHPVGELDCMFE